MERIPKPGEFYRHFKNRMYQIIAIATHSETMEKMVVYQALYGDFGVYVRPLAMFTEKVDREKYPEAGQVYRFELVTPSGEEHLESDFVTGSGTEILEDETTEAAMNPLLLKFLEADSFEERQAILQTMKGKVGQRELDSLCMVLDLQPVPGTVDDQLENIKRFLNTQQRFDSSRLRRG